MGARDALIPVVVIIAVGAAPHTALSQFSMDDDAGVPAQLPAPPTGQPTVDEEIEEPWAPPWAIIPEDPTVGHVAVVN